ncbi:MAG: histidine kinase [Cohaesibacter sp.]|nr:histidine kinase [Cohaesibacter sp.]
MPSIAKFLITLLILGGIGYGGMFALANFVKPEPKEVTIRIPAKDLRP